MTRLEAFEIKCKTLPYSKLAKRLKEAEFDKVVEFIEDNDSLEHLDFEYKVNRMFLGQPWTKANGIIMELLTVCNSASKGNRS